MIQRQLAARILEAATKVPVVSVTGPRQSGKTTLCRQLFPEYFYANLEHPETRAFALDDPRGFLAQGPHGMIIDEAQYAPLLFSYIQVLVDEQKQNGAFVLSGSQNFLLMERITQSLAGRVAVFYLLPFSYQELQAATAGEQSLWHVVLMGGYPRIFEQDMGLNLFFSSYIQTYVVRDLRQLTQVADLQQFQLFTRLTAGRVGQLFNQSAIANEAGLSHPTVKKWFSLLETSFIAFALPPYFRNFNKQLVKTPKVYFYDTGLACYLLGIRTVDELETHYARGALFENFVIVETLKSFYHRGIRMPLYFWRDRSGHEIDLLFETGGKLHPFEIKSGQTIQPDFFKNLAFFAGISGMDAAETTLVYGGDLQQARSQGRVMGWRHFSEYLEGIN